MAALSKKPARGGKSGKGVHGRMPTKRSINLVLVDENKVSIPKAILGILLIVGLAFLFGKYLVADRLVEVSQAAARVDRLQNSLDETLDLVNSFGDVENDYAHYTMDGMTQAELSLVDRVQVLDLVAAILPEPSETDDEDDEYDEDDVYDEDDAFFDEDDEDGDGGEADDGEVRYAINSWDANENVLTIEVTGPTLESLNLLARSLEESPIVDSCTISTANKGKGKRVSGDVQAKLIVYLQKPAEEVAAQ